MGEIMFLKNIRTEKSNLEAFLCSLKNTSYFLHRMIKGKIQERKGSASLVFSKGSGLVIKDAAVGRG